MAMSLRKRSTCSSKNFFANFTTSASVLNRKTGIVFALFGYTVYPARRWRPVVYFLSASGPSLRLRVVAALDAGDEAEGEWPCERLVASVRPQPQRMMRIQRGAR